MISKLEWLRANVPEFSGRRRPDLFSAATLHWTIERGAGLIQGAFITTHDRASLAVLLPELEAVGREECARLATRGRRGFEEIPWIVHEHYPSWLPERPLAKDPAVTRALGALGAAIESTSGPRCALLAPPDEPERRASEADLRRMLPAALEVLYLETNGMRVENGREVHAPIAPASTLRADPDGWGIVFGAWANGTTVLFDGTRVNLRPMLPGVKKPKRGKVRTLAPSMAAYLEALSSSTPMWIDPNG
jgi:hypothetical protein